MRIAAASIVAKNHLALGRVLARSFSQHHPEIPFFLLIADESDGHIQPEQEPFELINLDDLGIEDLQHMCFRYSQQTLSYACTPYLLRHLLDQGFDRVLFFKQETLVLGRVDDALQCLNSSSVLLTPHLVAPLEGPDSATRELRVLLSGVYNIGFMGVAETGETRRFLSWWSQRVRHHCLHDVGRGLHFEQRWMDLAPAYFDGIRQLRDPAYNVAHWNLLQRRVELIDGLVYADGRRCRVFRFSGFDPEEPRQTTRYFTTPRMDEIGEAALVFEDYLRRLGEEGHWKVKDLPYRWDRFDNGVMIPEMVRDIFRGVENGHPSFEHPFDTEADTGFYAWLRAPAQPEHGSEGSVSNLWNEIWRRRPDVRRVFPNPLGDDREGFINWTKTSGVGEHSIPQELAGQ